MSRKAICEIIINGQDVTSNFESYLLSVTVTDTAGTEADTCSIELDDEGGQILLPEDKAEILIRLGWQGDGGVGVFTGQVTDVRWRHNKGEGSVLTIAGSSADQSGKAKEPVSQHWEEESDGAGRTFGDVAKAAGEKAGFSVTVSDELGEIKRPYWAMTGESFLHWARRTAREIGATVKIQGKNASFTKRNVGKSAAKDDAGINPDLPTITASRGVNLIDADVEPIVNRPVFKTFAVPYWDPDQSEWKVEELEAGESAGAAPGEAKLTLRNPRGSKAEAKAAAESQKAEAERKKGSGTVSIEGNPEAMAEGSLVLVNCRPGVDGLYQIDTAEHLYSKAEGYVTRLSVARPGGDSGRDSRGDETE